jgi:DNA-binding GntR family transcriptional regulator
MNDDAAREAAFARAYRMIRTTIERRTETGQRLLVADFTRASGLSPTPVREALSRLVGEGLIEEHRGGGYYVPRLDARDVAEFYVLAQALALAALAERGSGPGSHRTRRFAASQGDIPAQAEAQIAYWLERIAIASGNRMLASEIYRLNGRMSGIRRAEIAVMAGLSSRLEDIGGLVEARDHNGQVGWVEHYCREGREHAVEIADWLSA